MSKVPTVNMSNYDKQGCLDEMFKVQANATPNAVAVINVDGSMVSSVVNIAYIKLTFNTINCYFNFNFRSRLKN